MKRFICFILLVIGLTLVAWNHAKADEEPAPSVQTQQLPESDALGLSDAELGKRTTQEPEAYVPVSVFGTKGGYVHPFMSVTFQTSDNINFSSVNEKSDWTAIYTPGIWLAAPAKRDIFLNLDIYNTSPGGRYRQIYTPESFTRYQAYALYVADIEDFNNHSERDTTKQSAEAYFRYNLRGGLSASIYNKYLDTEDPMAVGYATTGPVVDKYVTNLFGIIVEYDFGQKLRMRFDYNNFYLDYDKAFSKGKNRTDNSYSVYLYYDYSPKTSFFGEYEYVDVNYDISKIQNSTQNYGYLGIEWKPTGKVALKAKAGLINRDSKNPKANSVTDPVVELTYEHKFTAKTNMKLFWARKLNESTISRSAYSKDTIINLHLNKIITPKIEATLFLDYTRNDFKGNVGASRVDNVYTIAPKIRYVFKDWLQSEIGYEYVKRTSDVNLAEFEANTFFVRVSAGF